MLKIIKTFLRSEFCVTITAKLIFYIMRFSYVTTKWTLVDYSIPEIYIKSGKSLLVALWHDRLMTAPCAWSFSSPLNVLASAHRDGKLIARVVQDCGMIPVYGSTGKLSLESGRKLMNLCKSGACLAIIPDGPRGPRHKVSPGIIALAKSTATDILVFSSCVRKFKKCKSWDKFIIPYPFNKGAIVLDVLRFEDIKDLSVKDGRQMLEDRLSEASRKAKAVLEKMV